MGFNELKSQTRAVTLLKAGIRTGRIAHAYLFHGPRGVGKRKAALIFSRLINCEKPQDSEPCEVCLSCRKIKSGNHPDVLQIRPDGTSLKIAQIRDLQEKAYFKCYEAKFKVIMIDGADTMTIEAANSLLKILEEPPAQTVFIILAEDTDKLPVTIQSRSQAVAFSPLDEDVICAILAERGIDAKVPPGMARGSVGKALEIIEKINCEELRDKARKLFHDLRQGGYYEILSWAKELEKERDCLEAVLDLLVGHYRDMLLSEALKNRHETSKDALLPGVKYSIEGCYAALEKIEKAFYYLKGNANTRLVLEVLFINLRNIDKRERGSDPVG